MKRLAIGVLLLLLPLSLHAQDSLKVVTYNLEGMRPGTNYQVRLIFMIQFLADLDPDILCLQEVNETLSGEDNMAQTIADGLADHFGTPYYVFTSNTHIAWDLFNEGVGIVSKHPILEEGYRTLPQGVFPRKVVWARVDAPIGVVNLFSTHLSYRPEDNSVRVEQVRRIREYIAEKEEAYPSLGAVLGGDFNATPSSDPILLLTDSAADTFYHDSYAEANPGAPGYTIPADNPTARIDYLFLRNIGSLVIERSEVVMDQTYDASHYCSDHLGVMTVFTQATGGVDRSERRDLPGEIELAGNYPNPFNRRTTLSYRLGRPADVRLEVLDLLGRRVALLREGFQPPGFYAVPWSAGALGSGTYLFRMTAGGVTEVKKGVFLK